MRNARLAIAVIGVALELAGCTAPSGRVATHPAPMAPRPPASPDDHTARGEVSPPHINAAGLQIIKESEGLNLAAYQDGGQWLIGYGHADGAAPGARISAARAEELLSQDLAQCERAVDAALTRRASANQFSALVSLCYNIGAQRLAQSSLVRRFNEGDVGGAADGFLAWTKASVNGAKAVLPRLAARRQRERSLFLSG